jgi:ubiquinone/menaquinone biosynthesis C-methylase UbiE
MTDRRAFFEQRAAFRPRETERYYQKYLRKYFTFLVPPGLRVLEAGCGIGDLLAAVKPARGLGVDFSPAMVELARKRHAGIEFQTAEIGKFSANEKFDYVLLSDLVNDLPDVQAVLERLRAMSTPGTRLVVNFFNTLWRPILHFAEVLGMKAPVPLQNWLSEKDMENLLHLAGWEVVKSDARMLWPATTPLVDWFMNRWMAPLLKHFCVTVVIVARPRPEPVSRPQFSCSVVIPARNEAGNIEAAVQRTPEMGAGTEIIFIEGHSKDNTWEEIQRVAS